MEIYYREFLTIVVIHILAVASPGPDFALTLKQSVTYGRTAGIFTSIGLGAGVFVHMLYCILGLGVLISKSIVLFNMVKYIGAFYLIYIGFSSLRTKPYVENSKAVLSIANKPRFRYFLDGFITNALNPKATIFFLALFSVSISPATPIVIKIAYGAWMIIATIIWFSSVSLFFSRHRVRNLFNQFGHWFERFMGALLIGLGIKVSLSTVS